MSVARAFARRHAAIALVLVGAAIALGYQARAFDATASATYDEALYLEFGVDAWRRGTFWQFLKYGCAPLPILVDFAWTAFDPTTDRLSAMDVPRAISIARGWHLALAAIPLVSVATLWMYRRRGALAAAVVAGLLVGSPCVVAQASLATTDSMMALASLVGVHTLTRYRARATRRGYCCAGLGLGLALASKYTTLFLFVLALPAAWAGDVGWGRAVARWAGWVAIAVVVTWGAHGFLRAPAWGVQAPAPIAGMLYQVGHVRHGQANYLDGECRRDGWWEFYPKVFAYKSTPVEWLVLGIVLAAVCWRSVREDPTWRAWALAAALYFASLVTARIALGHRLLLLDYVLGAMLATDALARLLPARRFALVGALLVGGQWTSIAPLHPCPFEYMSPLAGGREEGWRHLVDCNLDWGQSLPPLARFLEADQERRVALAMFNYPTVQPAAYGIDAVHPLTASARELASLRWLVVSATELVGANDRRDPFGALRELDADARIGGALFAYRLQRADVSAALGHARRAAAQPQR